MNQADQQSNTLDQLFNELIADLKGLWRIIDNSQDEQALDLIQAFLTQYSNRQKVDSISTEEFDIQKKVLAKTREKTEQLLKQIEALESKHV
jgi:BMFP domain-containing protein YqiC